MQPTFTEIKKASLKSLKSRWPEAILAVISLISVHLLNIFSQSLLMQVFKVDSLWSFLSPEKLPTYSTVASILITLFSAVFSIFITYPFALGVLKWFWSVTNQSNARFDEVFLYFSSGKLFRKAVAVSVLTFIKIMLTAIICLLPYIICNILQSPQFFEILGISTPIWISGFFPLVSFLRLFGIVAFFVIISKYINLGAVLFTCEDIRVAGVFKTINRQAKTDRFRTVAFLLSFFGWFVASILIIPLFFVGPYFLASISFFTKESLRETKNL